MDEPPTNHNKASQISAQYVTVETVDEHEEPQKEKQGHAGKEEEEQQKNESKDEAEHAPRMRSTKVKFSVESAAVDGMKEGSCITEAKPRPVRKWWKAFRNAMVVASVVVLVAVLIYVRAYTRRPSRLHLVSHLVTKRCMPVALNFTSGLQYNTWDMHMVTASMADYMSREGVNCVSALNFGVPLCYMMIRVNDEIRLYFNLHILENCAETVVMRERSSFCSDLTFYRPRWPEIRVQYTSASGYNKTGYYDTSIAYCMQQLHDIQNGNKLCS